MNTPTRRSQRSYSRTTPSLHERSSVLRTRILPFTREKSTQGRQFIQKRPMASFFIALGCVFILILANALFSRQTTEQIKTEQVKPVSLYRVGTSSQMQLAGQVKKSGVIQIVAQTPAIVSSISVTEGQHVGQGTNLIQLSSSYAGGNAGEVQTAIAQKQYDLVKETYDTQLDIITKQRDIASNTNTNASEIRDITDQSVSETQSLIDLNNSILSTIDTNLTNLENTNQNGANDQTILSTKQLKAQLTAGNNQLKQALRTAQYQVDTDNPPTKLADLTRDLTLRQLDLQEKTLAVNRDISKLQVSLAAISAAIYHPTAPFSGAVERVHVSVGQAVNPGIPLITLSGDQQDMTVVLRVPGTVARSISSFEESTIYINRKTYKTIPTYISKEATEAGLYTVILTLPQSYAAQVTDGEYVQVTIPIGMPDTASSTPFIPLDSVYQTQDEAYVYVAQGSKAVAKQVRLGDVIGSNVEVLSGLKQGDSVITNRNILAGDSVTTGK